MRWALAALVVATVLVVTLRGGGEGRLYVHEDEPVFSVLYDDEALEVVAPGPGELLRLHGERKGLVATLTARRAQLPAYEGDVAGVLPVYADNYARARDLALTTDTRARVHGAPGYELGYEGGTTLILVAPDAPGTRDAVILTFEESQPDERDRGGGRRVSLAMRSALRSFQFGSERY